MSMIGEYARVTPAELDRARRDPEWALDLVSARMNAEPADGTDPAAARCLDIDKAWDAVGFLLRRTSFPVDIVHGEEELANADDWGYGPPRCLAPDRVRAAAEALASISGADLTAGVDPADLARSEVYPTIVWERGGGESLDYVREHYDALRPFFRAAADDGDGMLVWLG
ncbi:YfbM family protein [Streptomyces sp. NPDC101393]|uniref:YfbM family protein n=1 Tax=Streptomyces sp. NPDC101393 TaxID=3366141 RepID=UPI003830281B